MGRPKRADEAGPSIICSIEPIDALPFHNEEDYEAFERVLTEA